MRQQCGRTTKNTRDMSPFFTTFNLIKWKNEREKTLRTQKGNLVWIIQKRKRKTNQKVKPKTFQRTFFPQFIFCTLPNNGFCLSAYDIHIYVWWMVGPIAKSLIQIWNVIKEIEDENEMIFPRRDKFRVLKQMKWATLQMIMIIKVK